MQLIWGLAWFIILLAVAFSLVATVVESFQEEKRQAKIRQHMLECPELYPFKPPRAHFNGVEQKP
jgi:hypothetical protein